MPLFCVVFLNVFLYRESIKAQYNRHLMPIYAPREQFAPLPVNYPPPRLPGNAATMPRAAFSALPGI